jgi:hypothetical protein
MHEKKTTIFLEQLQSHPDVVLSVALDPFIFVKCLLTLIGGRCHCCAPPKAAKFSAALVAAASPCRACYHQVTQYLNKGPQVLFFYRLT